MRYLLIVNPVSGGGRQARRSGFDAVIAAGGDGTIREVIEGRRGTGNVFAREMGLPRGTKALWSYRHRTFEVELDGALDVLVFRGTRAARW